jgi:hypothetical protein
MFTKLLEDISRIDESYNKIFGKPGESASVLANSRDHKTTEIEKSTVLSHEKFKNHTVAKSHDNGAMVLHGVDHEIGVNNYMTIQPHEIPHLIAHLKKHHPEHF